MGLFRFLKQLSAQVKCDKAQSDKNNWIFLGNKMQHLIQDKNIFVEDNQLCIFRSKNKICDVLKTGTYKVCQDDLPLLYDRNNIHKKQLKLNKKSKHKKDKKIKVSCDIYFAKQQGINFVLSFKHKHILNNVKVVEKIKLDTTFNILDIQQLSKFLFLEIATVNTNKFNNLLSREFSDFIYKELNNFQGEIMDLEDEDISHAIRYKFIHEFGHFGLDITNFAFKEYQDLTKHKKPKKENIEVIKDVEVKEQNTQQENNLNNNNLNNPNYIDNNQYNNTFENNQDYGYNNNYNSNLENQMSYETNQDYPQENNAPDELFTIKSGAPDNQNNFDLTTKNESYKEVLKSGKIIIDPNDKI